MTAIPSTDADFAKEYMRREAEANKTPQGADARAIIDAMCEEYGWSEAEAVEAVFAHSIAGPC